MISNKKFAEYALNPAAFRNDLIVDVNGAPQRLGEVMEVVGHFEILPR